MARIGDVPIALRTLWNAETCPIELLPWLGWAVSVDGWQTDWTDDQKRLEVGRAIALQRTKGTRGAVESILERYDSAITIVEWWEPGGSGNPHTFEVVLPYDEAITHPDAAFSNALIADVTRYKPLRSHFNFVQNFEAETQLKLLGGAMVATFVRLDCSAYDAPTIGAFLLTQDGDSISLEDGSLLLI